MSNIIKPVSSTGGGGGGGGGAVYAAALINATSGTPSITKGNNIATMTDLGVGHYRANFTTNIPDVDYLFNGGATSNNTSSSTIFTCYQVSTARSLSSVTYRTGFVSTLASPFDTIHNFELKAI